MKELIDKSHVPQHIAVIMDGNGRWAKKRGMSRVFGHKNAIQAVREISEGSGELGVKYLTLYAFSTENWSRPTKEVEALMELLVKAIKDELPTLMKNNVKLFSIGDISNLPNSTQQQLAQALEITKNNTGLNLIIALSYSGKWDIVEATKKIAEQVKQGKILAEEIDEKLFAKYLSTSYAPDVDLMIRTGGDYRISNFMLWQLAYAELYIMENVFWPDFRKQHLFEAILDYQRRERRFGKISEQLKTATTNEL
ncbi:MAG: isoprenyl transferase [Thermoflexibacter sp.]|jgi:undecaprenyl diphosphate synthase|nr:isoprenyl transferase [Thermoflexibacter sp.]